MTRRPARVGSSDRVAPLSHRFDKPVTCCLRSEHWHTVFYSGSFNAQTSSNDAIPCPLYLLIIRTDPTAGRTLILSIR